MYYSLPQRGFTLVEVLVAISILLIVVSGSLRVVARATSSTAQATEQATAFYLAQEGLELVQAGRDRLVLGDFKDQFNIGGTNNEPDPWTRFQTVFAHCIDDGGDTDACGVRQSSAGVVVNNCTDPTNCRLYQRPLGSDPDFFTHVSTDTMTPFTRLVTIQVVSGGSRVRGVIVTSTVTWRTGSLVNEQRVQLSTYLANVYDTN